MSSGESAHSMVKVNEAFKSMGHPNRKEYLYTVCLHVTSVAEISVGVSTNYSDRITRGNNVEITQIALKKVKFYTVFHTISISSETIGLIM